MISLNNLWEKLKNLRNKFKKQLTQCKNYIAGLITAFKNVVLKVYRPISSFFLKIYSIIKFMFRKVYVWKILSVRKKWYQLKNGGLYNPKLKATVYPSWECTWNLSRQNDNLRGLDSKEYAQDIAFKLWMKKRRLKNKLGFSDIQMTIPLTMGPKILSNKIYIRKATTKDAPELLSIMEQLGYSQGDEAMMSRIQAYAYSTNNHIFIAERGKKIVGFVAFIIYDLFASSGSRCHIEEMVVGNNPSDLSIKRKLFQAVEDFARNNNGKIIDLTTGSYRASDPNYDFYKFMGYDNDNFTSKMYLKKEL
jgi:N-acetylglutamate synthase-like GNAT family acetyltransferase